jgi:hypothetical protein
VFHEYTDKYFQLSNVYVVIIYTCLSTGIDINKYEYWMTFTSKIVDYIYIYIYVHVCVISELEYSSLLVIDSLCKIYFILCHCPEKTKTVADSELE